MHSLLEPKNLWGFGLKKENFTPLQMTKFTAAQSRNLARRNREKAGYISMRFQFWANPISLPSQTNTGKAPLT